MDTRAFVKSLRILEEVILLLDRYNKGLLEI